MASTVYFTDLRATFQESLTVKLGRLVETAGLAEVVGERDLTAVKLHFGEKGNTAFIRPVFVSQVKLLWLFAPIVARAIPCPSQHGLSQALNKSFHDPPPRAI